MAGTKTQASCSGIEQKFAGRRLSVAGFLGPCLFYRKVGEEFSLEELTPEGICPDLFFALYPQYVNLLYDGSADESGQSVATVTCPGSAGRTTWRARGKKLFLAPLIELAYRFFRRLGSPKDLYSRRIEIECTGVDSPCPYHYKVGDRFSFNQYSRLWGNRFFCPSVYYALYPLAVSDAFTEETGDTALAVQCPADNTSIEFQVRRGEKGRK